MHRSRLPFWPVLLALPLSAFLTFAAEEKTVVNREAVDAVKQMLEIRLGSAATAEKQYVGTDACLSCHTNLKDFKKSLHHTGLKTAASDKFSLKVKDGIVADFDRDKVDDFKQGLDFNKVSSAFDRYKPNAPVLGYSAAKGYTITIAGVEYKVAVVQGGTGEYKQRFLVRINVTDVDGGLTRDLYYSPVQYNEMTGSYVAFSAGSWYNADNTPKITKAITAKEAAASGRSYNKDCAGCHSSNLYVSQDANNEWITQVAEPVYYPADEPHYIDINRDGYAEMHNVACERCHGPGSVHITNLGSAKDIINPERDFTALQKNELCGSCHSRGTSADGKHAYPLSAAGDDYSRNLGDSLFPKYFTENAGLWPDNKTSRLNYQQMQDLKKSAKWEFPFHKVYCGECHDPHAAVPGQIRTEMTVDGAAGAKLKLKVAVEDNSLCLACHAGFGPFATVTREMVGDMEKNRAAFASVTTAHTNHPYNPEGGMGLSRCTECHMAKMASSGDPYDLSSHTFEVVPGEKTLTHQDKGGMPNSCAVRCHRVMAPIYGLPVDLTLSTWTENSDKELSTWLSTYYGKNGVWWKTK